MKIHLKYPNPTKLQGYLAAAKKTKLTYTDIGATQTNKPVKGYDNDHQHIELGKGEAVWQKAKIALQNWQQFPVLWTAINPNTTPLQKDETVNMLFCLFGIWWVNATRIIYTLDSEKEYGFAYGTLEQHVEQGEECFWLARDENDVVTYHIKAFSKPRFWLARLGYPLARFFQKRFVRDSMNAMKIFSNA